MVRGVLRHAEAQIERQLSVESCRFIWYLVGDSNPGRAALRRVLRSAYAKRPRRFRGNRTPWHPVSGVDAIVAASAALQAFCGAKPWRRANLFRPSANQIKSGGAANGGEVQKERHAFACLSFWCLVGDSNPGSATAPQ